MNNVMSYALFGKFYETVPMILRAHHSVYPGWEIRIHHDTATTDAAYWKVLLRLEKIGMVKLVHVADEPRYTRAMLWRLLPIWDGRTDFVFCRDLDALPQPKERRAVEQFLISDKTVHGINDNAMHGIPLMGGMCGFHARSFIGRTGITGFSQLVDRCPRNWADHGTDQRVIGELWPQLRSGALIHRLHEGATPYVDCDCVMEDANWPLPDINPEVEARGDSFINYIGAAGTNTEWQVISRFYDKHANDAVKAIMETEKNVEAEAQMVTA